MNKRTYNPLTEGYSGKNLNDGQEGFTAEGYSAQDITKRGYTGKSQVLSAPPNIPIIKSAVTKPNNSNQSPTSDK